MTNSKRSPNATAFETGLITQGRDSLVGRLTDRRKLNGQVYTPLPLAIHMLQLVAWPAGDGVLLDPACGDGVFLEAAVRKVLAQYGATPRAAKFVRTRLLGWELDAEAANACRKRLGTLLTEAGLAHTDAPQVRVDNALLAREPARLACVVGNPPYLEAKRMPDSLKELIRQTCPLAAHGSFDLYAAFVERAVKMTSDAGGEVCLLIPNRFLVVRYAQALRERILAERDVCVLDFSQQRRVFGNAAVYPVVLHARTPPEHATPGYRAELARHGLEPGNERPHGDEEQSNPAAQRDESNRNAPASPRGATLSPALLAERLGSIMPVVPEHPGGRDLLVRLLADPPPGVVELKQRVSVRWCVSFHRAKLRERFVADEPHSSWQNPQPFLGGGRFHGNGEVQPFRIDWAGYWIDYDEERARRERNRLPSVELFARPKLVVCQNARRMRAALDRTGIILKDTFLALLPHNARPSRGELEWLCMVLNSRVLHYVYEHLYAGTRKQGGYLHYLARYLEPLPIPPMPEPPERVVARHRRLVQGTAPPADCEPLVERAYGLRPHEAEAIAAHVIPEHASDRA